MTHLVNYLLTYLQEDLYYPLVADKNVKIANFGNYGILGNFDNFGIFLLHGLHGFFCCMDYMENSESLAQKIAD